LAALAVSAFQLQGSSRERTDTVGSLRRQSTRTLAGGGLDALDEHEELDEQIASAVSPRQSTRPHMPSHRTTCAASSSSESATDAALARATTNLIQTADINGDQLLDEMELGTFLTRVFKVKEVSELPEEEVQALKDELDVNGDGFVDAPELLQWATASKHFPPDAKPVHALLVVDVQNDFINGSLALRDCPAKQDGEEVVEVINRLRREAAEMQRPFDVVACSLDWHPPHHCSFHEDVTDPEASSDVVVFHPSQDVEAARRANPFDRVLLATPQSEAASPEQADGQPMAAPSPTADGVDAAADGGRVAATAGNGVATAAARKWQGGEGDGGGDSEEEGEEEAAEDESEPMVQVLWPRHCVQNQVGSALHGDLDAGPLKGYDTDVLVFKGTNPRVDSYSAFYDNSRLCTPLTSKGTSLLQELRSAGVTHVYICGLALDVCVAYTAFHAREAGFVTSVVFDACRGVNHEDIESKMREMSSAGIQIVQSADVPRLMTSRTLPEALSEAIQAAMESETQEARRLADRDGSFPGHGPRSSQSSHDRLPHRGVRESMLSRTTRESWRDRESLGEFGGLAGRARSQSAQKAAALSTKDGTGSQHPSVATVRARAQSEAPTRGDVELSQYAAAPRAGGDEGSASRWSGSSDLKEFSGRI